MALDREGSAGKDRQATGLDHVGKNEMEREGTNQNSTGVDDMNNTGQDVTDWKETTWEEKRWDRMGRSFSRGGRRDGK